MPLTTALTTEEKEELRYAVRRYLASRPGAACTLDMIAPGLRAKGFDAETQDVKEALVFWVNTQPPQVLDRTRKHSTTQAWQITSEGVVAHDRGE